MLRRFWQASYSKLKSLEFGNGKRNVGPLSDFTPSTLKSQLEVCADSLERVKFVGSDKKGAELLSTFAKYSYPRLVDLEADVNSIEDNLFPQVVEKSPILKNLKWVTSGSSPLAVFPDGVRENLESLELNKCDSDGIVSMTKKLPNLKRLHIDLAQAPDAIIDKFLAYLQRLEVFYMRGPLLRELKSVWWPIHVKDATFIPPITNGLQFDNVDVVRIADSFSNLRNLEILDAYNISTPGIVALGQLEDLRKLVLSMDHGSIADRDNAFQFLTACKHLEIFRVDFDVHLSTVVGLIRKCPNLREISIQRLLGARRRDDVAEALLSLVDVGERKVELKFLLDSVRNPIWKRDPVKEALEKLKDGGVLINIGDRGDCRQPPLFYF